MPAYSTPGSRIVVARRGAMGDVLDTTPIVARLKDENPDTEIGVFTEHPDVYAGTDIAVNPGWDRYQLIELNDSFERRLRKKNPITCYSLDAFGDEETPLQVYLRHDRSPCMLPEGLNWQYAIAIHPAKSWPQRTLPLKFWKAVVGQLRERGWQVVVLGTEQDHEIEDADGVFNTRGQISLARQAFFIDNCQAFICSDSGLLNVAMTTRTPVVGLLTMTLPGNALRVRRGELGWGFYPIMASVPCVGCTALQTKPASFFACKWDDERKNSCVEAFSSTTVVWKAASVARQHANMGMVKSA